jgi:hypothetical protein
MSELAAPQPRRAVVRPLTPIPPVDAPMLGFYGSVIAAVVLLAALPPDYRHVVAPVLTISLLALLYVVVLQRRDKRVPVFEIGSLWVASTFMYSVYPVINFIAGGLEWHALSDMRLRAHDPGPRELGIFAWRYVVYFGAFVAAYLPIRGKLHAGTRPMKTLTRSRVVALVLIFVAELVILWAISRFYGISYNAPYADIVSGRVKTLVALPHVVLQVAHNLLAIRFLLLQFLIGLLIIRWRDWRYRALLIGGLLADIIWTTINKGHRSEVVLLLLTVVLFFDRFVRPLRLRVLVPGGILLLGGFLVQGVMRDMRGLSAVKEHEVNFLTTANEFSAVYGTSFDIYMWKITGTLPPVPWQIYFSDFYFLVPSQLLPFEKIDPSAWYLQMAGIEGVGFMFGAMSQAILGYDWIELLIRGLVLGALAAWLHRWYVRRADAFWPTMFYMFMTIWTYNSTRQTSFAVLYYVVYRFIPAMLAVELVALVLRRGKRQVRVAAGQS